jgi:hypothetical protein
VKVPRDKTHGEGGDYDPDLSNVVVYGQVCEQLKGVGATSNVQIIFGCPGIIIEWPRRDGRAVQGEAPALASCAFSSGAARDRVHHATQTLCARQNFRPERCAGGPEG